ncbi:Regulator of chromosome condensation (RCC1) repeat [Carpediemonas membranifera]|uniref:Regulator of chromosome condensation (RCC1) repeat n=1 Tax=Carpediemonas membranifera TaxID=201153 RepID=A0A8J6E5L3_9EUKA|nr:Regulator of chromosome condensation (RCC1) repeat [Carpediemonas membranifera]|eukprot:KAG9395932.1 Regulator of chromosome condensation (RCC1) repeat [Carpediemonas membranifera]
MVIATRLIPKRIKRRYSSSSAPSSVSSAAQSVEIVAEKREIPSAEFSCHLSSTGSTFSSSISSEVVDLDRISAPPLLPPPPTFPELSSHTIWALLLAAEADPDLAASEVIINDTNTGVAGYAAETRPLWFLSRQCFKALSDSLSNGKCTYLFPERSTFRSLVALRLYGGRVFSCGANWYGFTGLGLGQTIPTYRRVKVHAVQKIFTNKVGGVIAQTARGLYAWGDSSSGALGIGYADASVPTRVEFAEAPKLAALERTFGPWERSRAIHHVAMGRYHTFIVTRVGVAVAGLNYSNSLGAGVDSPRMRPKLSDAKLFIPVPLPPRFVPKYVIDRAGATVLRHRRVAVVVGDNTSGRLGIGPCFFAEKFTKIGLPVDDVRIFHDFSLFAANGTTYLSGRPSDSLRHLLVTQRESPIPEKLALPFPCKRLFIGLASVFEFTIVVRADRTESLCLLPECNFDSAAESDAILEASVPGEVTRVRWFMAALWLGLADGTWLVMGQNDPAAGDTVLGSDEKEVRTPAPMRRKTPAWFVAEDVKPLVLCT